MADQEFRDKISTIDDKGKRIWIFPKKPKGKYYNRRKIISWFFLAFLFAGPHVRIGGEPLLMFNILARKFVIFGNVFWPQDMYLFASAFIIALVFIILFTVVFGRLFCGWVCPQTVFLEMVFRPIEYWIDGDRNAQMKLKKAPWTTKKIFKRVLKHSIFFGISFMIANTFLSYIIGSDALWEIQLDKPSEHILGLSLITIFSGVFYGVFAWMREQICTTVCPYGRLQGVMLDRNTVNVTYDYERGEPRGKLKKDTPNEKGDCIDCGLCVQVCPTGIDIRNGTQLECVNCTACIDECDTVMNKVGKPEGLIRYASEASIADKKPWALTVRAKAYIGLLCLLLVIFSIIVANRSVIDGTILRAYGTTYKQRADGTYINFYKYKFVNKAADGKKVWLVLENLKGSIQLIGGDTLDIQPNQPEEGTFIVELKEDQLDGLKTPIEIGIYTLQGKVQNEEIYFSGPIKIK